MHDSSLLYELWLSPANAVTANLEEAIRGKDRGTDEDLDGLDRAFRVARSAAAITEAIGGAAAAGGAVGPQIKIREVRPAPVRVRTRKVFHKGELLDDKVSTQRELSTGLERESVEALQRPGKVHEFEIPEDTLLRWEMEGKVRRLRDYDHETGTYNEELRFSPTVAEELNKCKVN